MQKKVLLISYHFPPSAEVGGLRTANFARRLPQFGWEPYVLTLKDRYLRSTDPEKLDFACGAKIFKAGQTPTLSQAYLACKSLLLRFAGKKRSSARMQCAGRAGGPIPRPKAESPSMRFRRYVLAFLNLPDPQRNWILPAVIAAVRIVRRERIHCVVTSCPPYSAHLVGWITKSITGVKWIADFRDPWMTASSKSLFATCAASLAIERWMERRVVESAHRIVANTEMLRGDLERAYSGGHDERFICITNAFDRDLFSRFSRIGKRDKFTIVYTGSLYFGRSPEPVFRAVNELINEGAVGGQEIQIHLVGQCRAVDGIPIESLIERYELSDAVEVRDPVPYLHALEMVKEGHLALLLAPNQPYQIPAKVYDYMGLQTRVLALARDGATARLIRSTGIGSVFEPEDTEGIKRFIRESLAREETGEQTYGPESVSEFEIGSTAGRLASVLDGLLVTVPGSKPMSGRV